LALGGERSITHVLQGRFKEVLSFVSEEASVVGGFFLIFIVLFLPDVAVHHC